MHSDSINVTTDRTLKLSVQGMHCASCVARVEHALTSIDGVASADVNLVTGQARVHLASSHAPEVDKYLAAVRSIGYSASLATDGSLLESQANTLELTRAWQRLMVAIPATVLVVAIHMGGWHFPGSMGLMALLSGIVLFWSGSSILANGLRGLVRLAPDMDALVALGALSAWIISFVAMLWPRLWIEPPHYFEAAATVVCFVLIGRTLEQRARRETGSVIDALLKLQPATASLWDNGTEREVAIDSLRPGDVVRIRPGQRIPVDGVVLEGTGAVDQSMVTGESLPVDKHEGDEVLAGTMNQSGGMLVRVRTTGEATFLQRVAALVRDAQGSKAPIARLADRVAGIFVPVVIGIAVLTFIVWLTLGPTDSRINLGILAAVTVLVISCPCALGLATPTAIATAMGRAAELGLLVRDGAILERTAKVDTVVFDKTGTLTHGRFKVLTVEGIGEFKRDDVLHLAAAVERGSEHPLARAIVAEYEREHPDKSARQSTGGLVMLGLPSDSPPVEQSVPRPPQVTGFTMTAGKGALALVDGRSVAVGNGNYLAEQRVPTEGLRAACDRETDQGRTCVFVAVDHQLAGLVALGDQLKEDAAQVVEGLRAQGLQVHVLTGDKSETARAVLRPLGIDSIHAELLPADKTRIVRDLQQQGRVVAMVGDGVNDAPVLAAADVGMAVGTGTDVAIAAAPVTITSGEVRGVSDAVQLSRRTLHIIRQNLLFAFLYNVLGIPLAAGVLFPATGWLLPPTFAALAMSASSVSVVLNSLRLRR